MYFRQRRTWRDTEQVLAALEQADRMLRSGCLHVEVCRTLGMSHVVYHRLRTKYGRPTPTAEQIG